MLEDFDEGAAVLCAFVSLFMNKSTRIMTNTGRKGESYIYVQVSRRYGTDSRVGLLRQRVLGWVG